MKKLILLVIILTTMCLLIARYSDQYPLGTYSFISEEDWFMNHLHTQSGAMNSLESLQSFYNH